MEYPERPCDWCGTPSKPVRRTGRTCSTECRKRDNRYRQNAKRAKQHKPKPCDQCRVEYTPTRSDSRYCSRECLKAARLKASATRYVPKRDRRPTRVCIECGDEFKPVRDDAQACSRSCGARIAYKRKATERVQAATTWNREHKAERQAITRRYKDKRRVWEATGSVSNRDWKKTLNRYANSCAYCGAPGDLHMDHIVPLSRGGRHSIGNVVPACQRCNLSKHNKYVTEWKRTTREVMNEWQISTQETAKHGASANTGPSAKAA